MRRHRPNTVEITCPLEPCCDDDDPPMLEVTLTPLRQAGPHDPGEGIALDDLDGTCVHVRAERAGTLSREEVDTIIDATTEALEQWAER